MKCYIIILILIIIDIYFLTNNMNLEIEKSKYKNKYNKILYKNKKERKFNDLIIKKPEIISNKINLIAFISEKGCGLCKDKLIKKFLWYKNKFGSFFKVVLIGENNLEIKINNKKDYKIFKFASFKKLFNNTFKESQPFILLADKSGRIILSHEMIPGDDKIFNNFNTKLESIINIINNI